MSDEPLPQSSLILYQTEDGRTRGQAKGVWPCFVSFFALTLTSRF